MSQPITTQQDVLSLFLPPDTLEWFNIIEGTNDKEGIRIVLEEKNNPPLGPEHDGRRVSSKGFYDITVTDFPIRGRRTNLVFRRRRWQVEGERELLKRDIPLTAPGTSLAAEFADFLKDASRDKRRFFGVDRQKESSGSKDI